MGRGQCSVHASGKRSSGTTPAGARQPSAQRASAVAPQSARPPVLQSGKLLAQRMQP
jgi:hypothetical protein